MRGNVKRHEENGFSLIEVILALGLLAAVLVTMAGLLVLGAREAKSGRTASEALSVAQTILEETQGWGFRQTYSGFGFDGTATSYTVDTRTNSYASKWQAALDSKLFNSYAVIDLESLGPGTPPMASTQVIRVIVTVHWEEEKRPRRIRLGAVRM